MGLYFIMSCPRGPDRDAALENTNLVVPSYETIDEEYRPKLYRYFLGRGCQPNDAENLVQETLRDVWISLRTFDNRVPINHLIYQIASNRWSDLHRKRMATKRSGNKKTFSLDTLREFYSFDMEDPKALRRVNRGTYREDIRLLLQNEEVNQPNLQTLKMRILDGMSFAEIANALDLDEATVRMRISRVRRELLALTAA